MSKMDRQLQQYFDGELGPDRAREVEERLAADPRQQEQLAALESMRSMLRESTEAAARGVAFEEVWAGVQRGLEHEAPVGLIERLGMWLRGHRLALATAAAAVVALAVGLTVVLSTHEAPPRNDAVIESLEVGPGAVSTIFTIEDPGQTGETTVIWVTETSVEGDL